MADGEISELAALIDAEDLQPLYPPLRSMFQPPQIRARLHTICALYYYSPRKDLRRALLEKMEDLTLELAHLLALDLLENGWRPNGWGARTDRAA
jgi:hypothetical protein